MKRAAVFLAAIFFAARGAAQTDPGVGRAVEDFQKRFPAVKQNAAAGELERLALALGIDVWAEDAKAEHPPREDAEAYRQAGISSWLTTQIKTVDDSIGSPPAKLKTLLESKDAALARIVALLEKETPGWAFDPREPPGGRPRPPLLLAISIQRVLLSAALIREEAGRSAEAADLLEASWSLLRSISWQPDLGFQLIALASAELQAGVLRRMREPSFAWTQRLSDDAPWQAVLTALESQGIIAALSDSSAPKGGATGWRAVWMDGWKAVTDELRNAPPCDVAKRSIDELWRPMTVALSRWTESGADPGLASRVFKDVAMPSAVNPLRRAARLLLDRELTKKVIDLRAEKAASRSNEWPEKFIDLESRVCPGVSYEYRTAGGGMTIRFTASISAPDAPALVLPVSFEARAPKATPTPTPAPHP